MFKLREYTQISFLFFIITAFLLTGCDDKPRSKLIEIKTLPDYPSGSGLVYRDGHLYVIGDDAPDLLVMDTSFHVTNRISLYDSTARRIPKDIKPDIESITMIKQDTSSAFLLTGSGSLSPYRNVCWTVNAISYEKKQYRLDTFFNRLKNEDLRDLNIEGTATLPFGIVLACRGNKSFAKNYLVITSNRFWLNQESAGIQLIKAGANTDTASFAGISGLDYSYITDQLLITVSTEDTRNSYDDGAIGKSYLWIINDISSKRRWSAINPDKIIDLEELDPRFEGNKVESVCIVTDNKQEKELILVADNDKGGTVLFKMIL